MSDYYGKLLVESTRVQPNRGGLELTILQVREMADQHQLRNLVVPMECTGTYIIPEKSVSLLSFSCRILERDCTPVG
jgi:hypothetical protein